MIKLLKIDQTPNWDPEFLLKYQIMRMFGVYVFDSAIRVHACEVAPSFECHFVESQPDYPEDLSESQREQMLGEIIGADAHTDPIAYYHVSDVEQMAAFRQGFFPPDGKSGALAIRGGWSKESMGQWDKDKRRSLLMEEALEYCRQNAV